jgi:ribosomal protein S18 acetylase RimI-like enzyme
MQFKIVIFIIFIFNLCYLIKTKIKTKTRERFTNSFIHPDLVRTCFSEKEIRTFNQYYRYSKIIYGKNKRSVCYLTPTNVLNEIPIISWNGYYINNFCVDKNYRKNGYGTNLLNKIVQTSTNEGKDHLILQVNDDNKNAKHLYYKMGFVDHFKGLDDENILKLFLVKYL